MGIETFRSRARVIDLLGRQQIADAPTATGELFKNALDAGAKRVQVDYVDTEHGHGVGFLRISDDGLGMRLQEDVVEKWLVLATESKFAKKSNDGWAKFATEEQRQWIKTAYGEKGIGRLSVASLGRMTILWSVWGDGAEKRGALCIVHWHLFQHPKKLLDDLPIPCAEFDHVPSVQEFDSVFSELRKSDAIKDLLDDTAWDKQLAVELKADLLMPSDQIYAQLKCDFNMGTTFLCVNTSEDIPDLFRASAERKNALEDAPPSVLKSANAFSCFWDPFHERDPFRGKLGRKFSVEVFENGKAFRQGEQYRYWSPDDFKQCDHHIRIKVSETGFAEGYIENYQAESTEYSRQLKALQPGMKSPGEFIVEIGYVQGSPSASFLPVDLHHQMDTRLKYAGGFSVYKGGVHIQPYGTPESDFAGFEQRRLKNAGRYYFSHLRMFGGLFLPVDNVRVKEKAGREGFIWNGASRALRFWIEDIFVDIADRYLGRKADREDKRKVKEEKAAKAVQERLAKEKAEYLQNVRYARGWLSNLKDQIKSDVNQSRKLLSGAFNAAPGQDLAVCEKAIKILRSHLEDLQSSVSNPPDGVVILGDTWDVVSDYISKRGVQIANLQAEIARQAQQLQVLSSRAQPMQDRERKFVGRLTETDEHIRREIDKVVSGACKTAESLAPNLRALAEKEIEDLQAVRTSALNGLTPRKVAEDKSGESVVTFEKAVQAELDELEMVVLPRLRTLCTNVQHLTDWQSGIYALSDQTRELQVLREQHSHLVTAAQLGLVFETATHEYEKQVECVRNTIEWLDERLTGEEKSRLLALKDSFGIIDERIRLMDPLIRRRNLRSESLTGAEIEDFLRRRFVNELKVVGCKFTDAFRKAKWSGLNRPVFLGAIHNLFINSLYWARQGVGNPMVCLSTSDGSLVLSDSGPGVNKIDADYVFEPGFSRRPEGQGLGLYIARESLYEFGYSLSLQSEPELGALGGANFIISKIS